MIETGTEAGEFSCMFTSLSFWNFESRECITYSKQLNKIPLMHTKQNHLSGAHRMGFFYLEMSFRPKVAIEIEISEW